MKNVSRGGETGWGEKTGEGEILKKCIYIHIIPYAYVAYIYFYIFVILESQGKG